MKKIIQKKLFLLTLIFTMLIPQIQNKACTRVVYCDGHGTVITARSMDWYKEIPANLWVFPRGMERDGLVGENSMKWKSKYGSVLTSSYDFTSADGMNEKGLVANMLWLGESQYPKFDSKGKKKGLAVSIWLAYVLDNFSTVNEVVEALAKEDIVVVTLTVPNSNFSAALHLCVSDPTGDNAVFEYINEKLVIHHSKDYKVVTNSPSFEEQLAINTYWKDISGSIMLPGTHRAADRFVRGSFYINSLQVADNTRVAIASAFSVIRNCSVPFGVSSEQEPNISPTRWRTVADQKNKVYYFENVINPNVVWVDFKNLDFSENAPVKKLSLDNNQNYAGESSMNFIKATPFNFLKVN
jgi:choloylglycine hydrolase